MQSLNMYASDMANLFYLLPLDFSTQLKAHLSSSPVFFRITWAPRSEKELGLDCLRLRTSELVVYVSG